MSNAEQLDLDLADDSPQWGKVKEARDIVDEMSQLMATPGWQRLVKALKIRAKVQEEFLEKPITDPTSIYRQEFAKGCRAEDRYIMELPELWRRTMQETLKALTQTEET
ncbi:MAG: hypothetical protein IIA11_02645 [Proteobacteria bacterium]|nr:hypothetical protein [Pseudomonadota bacterium]